MSEVIKKSAGGIRPGMMVIKVTYDVPATKSGQRAYKVTRDNWVLPQTAMEQVRQSKEAGDNKVQINWDKMKDKGITAPRTDDPQRLHSHTGAEKPHAANVSHSAESVKRSGIEEANRYWELTYGRNPDKIKERLHSHYGAQVLHSAAKSHGDVKGKTISDDPLLRGRSIENEDVRVAHNDELATFEDNLLGRTKDLSWLDEYNVKEKEVQLPIHGVNVDAIKYQTPLITMYVFEYGDDAFITSKETGLKRFSQSSYKRPMASAVEYIKDFFKKKKIRKSVDNISKTFALKNKILKSKFLQDNQDPSALIKADITYNKFTSGDNNIILAGKDGKYAVSENGAVILNSDDFGKAISKYYKMIAGIIEAECKDKNISLEVLGDIILQRNRQIRPMVEKLGDTNAKAFFDEFNFEDYPVESLLEKQLSVNANCTTVSTQEDMQNGTGSKATRGDLKESDFKNTKKQIQSSSAIDGFATKVVPGTPNVVTN